MYHDTVGSEQLAGNARQIDTATSDTDLQNDRTVGLATLPHTRRQILEAIKRHGEARAEDLANELEITVSGVRQHLNSMAAAGLVAHREVKGGPGRPKFYFRLTPDGESLFPRRYGELTHEIMLFLEDEDPALLDRMLSRRVRARVARARARLKSDSFQDRLRVVVRMLDEEGYLAGFEPLDDGTYRIVEHNCAVLAVASRHPQVCSSEMSFLQALLPDAEIERTSHMLAGSPTCSYIVRPCNESATIS